MIVEHSCPLHFISGSAFAASAPGSAWPLEVNFQDEDGLSIDLHRHLLKSEYYLDLFNVDMRGIWARSIPVDGSNGNDVWSANLSPYDMLAHLCLHQARSAA